jgi:hypothetical protein
MVWRGEGGTGVCGTGTGRMAPEPVSWCIYLSRKLVLISICSFSPAGGWLEESSSMTYSIIYDDEYDW